MRKWALLWAAELCGLRRALSLSLGDSSPLCSPGQKLPHFEAVPSCCLLWAASYFVGVMHSLCTCQVLSVCQAVFLLWGEGVNGSIPVLEFC
jgi:hypothetical protein